MKLNGAFKSVLVGKGSYTDMGDRYPVLDKNRQSNIEGLSWETSPALPTSEQPRYIRDFDSRAHVNRRIATGDHCFGCTAWQGSSCGGALT